MSGQILAVWDGRGQQGQSLPAGQYQILVRSLVPGGGEVLVTALVAMAPAMWNGATLVLLPNPAVDEARIVLGNTPAPVWLVRIYTVSAELVWRSEIPGTRTSVTWDLRGPDGRPAASGLYFVLVEPKGGQPGERRVGRLVVVR